MEQSITSDTTVDGVWGLEIDPEGTEIIPYRLISSIREDACSRNLILTLDDGTERPFPLTPFPFLSGRAKRRHQRAEELAKLINQHR